jgi:hypothetical protein
MSVSRIPRSISYVMNIVCLHKGVTYAAAYSPR